MAHQTLKFRITGEVPLLMHNGQLADPLNKWSKAMKAVSGKRKKTDSDHEEMARLQWYGSLYLLDGKPCLPGEVIEATFINAAKKSKLGTQAKMGVFCPGNYPLHYDDEHDSIDDLWNGNNHRHTCMGVINRNRVPVTRPMFTGWSVDCEIVYDDEVLNEREMWTILETAGRYIGLCDWRPRYGRFTVSSI